MCITESIPPDELRTEATALGGDTNGVTDAVRETMEWIRREYGELFERLAK